MNALLPFILALGALVGVAVVVVGLGMLFLSVGNMGTIVIGLAIILLVPLVGLLVVKMDNSSAG